MRNYRSYTGRGNDVSTRNFVLSHEVDGELCAVHDAFVIDVCTQHVGLGRNSNRHVSFQ